jgi:hypothetical protein
VQQSLITRIRQHLDAPIGESDHGQRFALVNGLIQERMGGIHAATGFRNVRARKEWNVARASSLFEG